MAFLSGLSSDAGEPVEEVLRGFVRGRAVEGHERGGGARGARELGAPAITPNHTDIDGDRPVVDGLTKTLRRDDRHERMILVSA